MLNNNKILIVGQNNDLAKEFIKVQKKNRGKKIFIFTRKKFNYIENTKLLKKKLEEINPYIIINFAAVSDQIKCELNKNLCIKTNYQLTKKLSRYSTKNNCYFIFFSTDRIFFNFRKKLNTIFDKPNPKNLYGKTKLMSEKILLKNSKSLIIRLPHLFSKYAKKGLFFNIRKSLKNRKKIYLANDIFFSPINVKDVSYFLDRLIKSETYLKKIIKKRIIHLSYNKRYSRYEFIKKIYKNTKFENLIFGKSSDKIFKNLNQKFINKNLGLKSNININFKNKIF